MILYAKINSLEINLNFGVYLVYFTDQLKNSKCFSRMIFIVSLLKTLHHLNYQSHAKIGGQIFDRFSDVFLESYVQLALNDLLKIQNKCNFIKWREGNKKTLNKKIVGNEKGQKSIKKLKIGRQDLHGPGLLIAGVMWNFF